MSNDAERETAEALRALFLRHNATHHTHGVYGYAQYAAGARTVPALLRDVAANGPQTAEERVFLHQLLLAVAEGRDVRKELRIDAEKVGHKPPQTALNADIVRELQQREADGQTATDAVAAVANITGKTPDAVRKIWQRAKR